MKTAVFSVFLLPPLLLVDPKSSVNGQKELPQRVPAHVREENWGNESNESYIRCISDCDLEGLKMNRCEKRCSPKFRSKRTRGL